MIDTPDPRFKVGDRVFIESPNHGSYKATVLKVEVYYKSIWYVVLRDGDTLGIDFNQKMQEHQVHELDVIDKLAEVLNA